MYIHYTLYVILFVINRCDYIVNLDYSEREKERGKGEKRKDRRDKEKEKGREIS